MGFTLIELMVVIAIISILAVIAITLFSGAQRNGRDARRRSDIQAMASALETNKAPGVSTYSGLAASQFTAGSWPTDPGNNGSATYCINTSTTTGATPPAPPATWTNPNPCPAAYGYSSVGAGSGSGATAWTVCALLETGSTPYGGNPFCVSSAQQ